MKVLLSSIGSRGDVQPILALARGALQIATRSITELSNTPYIFAASFSRR